MTPGRHVRHADPQRGRRAGVVAAYTSRTLKRHESLVPLSRQHHDGLVLAQRLILGRSTAPRAPWPTDRRRQVDLLIQFFEAVLGPHFDAEEAHLFPAVVEHVRDGGALIHRLVDEHDDMRAQIRDLHRDPTTRLNKRLPAFGQRLRQHIQTEERVLFERIQQEMKPVQLEALAVSLSAFYASADAAVCPT